MGIEFRDMDLSELDDMLYEVSKDNKEDMSTFMGLLIDMYGGIDMRPFDELHEFIHNELGIHSDAELAWMSEEQKYKIINHIHS